MAAQNEGTSVKKVIAAHDAGENLLDPGAWRPWQKGFEEKDGIFLCDNASDSQAQRGVSQTVELNQSKPAPIVALAWSKADGVGGSRGSDYSLYLDLVYTDGSPLWGQVTPFNVGTHDWEEAEVLIFPEKPVRSVSLHMLLRRHSGKVWFRDPELRVINPPAGACLFDGVPVSLSGRSEEGFQVRDVIANSDFIRIERRAVGLELDCSTEQIDGATFFDVTISDTTGKDRAITLVYAVPVSCEDCVWLQDARRNVAVEPGREYLNAGRFSVGANGRLSRYPFAAVAVDGQGIGLGIDMDRPAFFRVGYNAGTEELFLAYDIGLAKEKPTAHLRFCKFIVARASRPRDMKQGQDGLATAWGFRAALAKYYELFPDSFRCRTAEQGLWMPFAKISDVNDWQDFGFKFKEGNNETGWDDAHGITTFRYTEPMTWWMSMPKEMPRTLQAALDHACRLANEKADPRARAFLASGFHDQQGQFSARLQDTPWCDGAVWSINSMPKITGDVTDFKNKWNPELRERLYGPQARAVLDGEYIDSSEGYVTDELDFRREHFAAAQTPLTFSLDGRKVAVFRGLIVFEYMRAIAQDVHAMDKLMMANSTPYRLCWLAPLCDVLGSETDWNPSGRWQPMSDGDLLYRRSLCKGKPYCFLMNTRFEEFSHELVEKYMKRALAYGMFPGFFSHNASQGHYFTRPELYERDRDLFKKYVPLCKLVAEAGWEPVTLAHSSDPRVYVERFGDRLFTVFNDSDGHRTVMVRLERDNPSAARELIHGRTITWQDQQASLMLDGQDVAVIEID
ncbi:MAG: hypothetical protein A2Z25_09800 [Planctomycetes bacterium RBG_16_55_9]|nr:MAG: hypothetical protein A2Z25_09800 [Planctomycetes bacterium RBG_16_55_9]